MKLPKLTELTEPLALTRREHQVMRRLANGRLNKEIAADRIKDDYWRLTKECGESSPCEAWQ